MTPRARRVHVVGIGGIGLSAIARVLIARGYEISGSDLDPSPITDELSKLGAKISIGHCAKYVGDVDLVLATSAARANNPEVVEAKRRGIRVVGRYDFFPELIGNKKTIAVAGTHGKTTTTGMIAAILIRAGLDPTVIAGGVLPEINSNARVGSRRYFVIEADEYERTFLGLHPSIAVITSIDMDHPDTFRDLAQVEDAFRQFIKRVPQTGLIVGCGDHERVAKELQQIKNTAVIRYGLGVGNDWRAVVLKPNEFGGMDFAVQRAGAPIANYKLLVPGKHNVLNALAALVVSDYLNVNHQDARAALKNFRGVARRFEVKGEFGGVTLVDDYAHHPAEIRATLAAARDRFPNRKIWAVFQPHTFSRTHALLSEFAHAFPDADHVIVTGIYAAREAESKAMSGAEIINRMKHPDARFISDLDQCVNFLREQLKRGDVLITLGAGDVNTILSPIARSLQGAA